VTPDAYPAAAAPKRSSRANAPASPRCDRSAAVAFVFPAGTGRVSPLHVETQSPAGPGHPRAPCPPCCLVAAAVDAAPFTRVVVALADHRVAQRSPDQRCASPTVGGGVVPCRRRPPTLERSRTEVADAHRRCGHGRDGRALGQASVADQRAHRRRSRQRSSLHLTQPLLPAGAVCLERARPWRVRIPRGV